MKRKLIIAIVVLFLFGVMTGYILTVEKKKTDTRSTVQFTPVKICPHSGLPCDGDGDCAHEDQHDN